MFRIGGDDMSLIDSDWMKGYNAGLRAGQQKGHENATDFFYNFLYSLHEIDGVGQKTAEKIQLAFIDRAQKVVDTYAEKER